MNALAPPPFLWTNFKEAKLRQLWSEGIPCSQIGKLMGTSKNAIIGKANRLKLPARASGFPRSVPKPRKPKALKMPVGRPPKDIEPKPSPKAWRKGKKPREAAWNALPGSSPVELVDLEPHHCRWPIGADSPFLYCAQHRHQGSSYCEAHALMAGGTGTARERAADRFGVRA
jgi:GcrA cell cycle regulator